MSEKTEYTKYMNMAFSLALKGLGKTSPNPLVGAVIVKNNKIIAVGYHRGFGKEHAEINALKLAKNNARGATLYVNLEPCCHVGKTGPCCEAIIKAGIKKVVFSNKDINPLVNGKGASKLKKAGIEVISGISRKDGLKLNEIYFNNILWKRPFVILKIAQSLDGRLATKTGDSKYISSEDTLKQVHRLRSTVDAVLIGGNTFEKDNPLLTVRKVRGENPYRIVLSKNIELTNENNIVNDNSDRKTIIATSESNYIKLSKTKAGRDLIYWIIKKNKQELLDLKDFLNKAFDFGIRSILVEGGSKLATSFFRNKLVDKFILISSPIVIGSGIDSINDLMVNKLSKAVLFRDAEFIKSGTDNMFVGYPEFGE